LIGYLSTTQDFVKWQKKGLKFGADFMKKFALSFSENQAGGEGGAGGRAARPVRSFLGFSKKPSFFVSRSRDAPLLTLPLPHHPVRRQRQGTHLF